MDNSTLDNMSVKERVAVKLRMIFNYMNEVITVNSLVGGFPPDVCSEGETLMKMHDEIAKKAIAGEYSEDMEKELDVLGPRCIRLMMDIQVFALATLVNQSAGGVANHPTGVEDMVKQVLNEVKNAKDGKLSIEDRSSLVSNIDPSKLN